MLQNVNEVNRALPRFTAASYCDLTRLNGLVTTVHTSLNKRPFNYAYCERICLFTIREC